MSKNNTRTCWVLKCDIKKFFANIDHNILLDILAKYIPEKNILWLLQTIIESFETRPQVGLPLGNLTSQLFINIYMNEFDQFMKHKIKAVRYIRYADDFVILSQNRQWLEEEESLQSYLGLLSHGDTYYWQQYIVAQFLESQSDSLA